MQQLPISLRRTFLGTILSVGGLVLSACTPMSGPQDERIKVLQAQGLTDPKLTGSVIYGCADDDSFFYNQTFEATRDGRKIEGYICGGLMKGWTVRYK